MNSEKSNFIQADKTHLSGLKIGDKVNKLEILNLLYKLLPSGNKSRYAECRCECGEKLKVLISHLKKGQKSCRKCQAEAQKTRDDKTRLYKIYITMKQRCSNPNSFRFDRYGGRGINVCEDWKNNFEKFREWSLNNGWDDSIPNLSIERIDNNKNYFPDNCKWIHLLDQAKNTSRTIRATIYGETKILADWAKDPRCKVDRHTFNKRIKNGWEPEKALTEPKKVRKANSNEKYTYEGQIKTLFIWAKDERCTVSYPTVKTRINNNWSFEDALLTPVNQIPLSQQNQNR